MRRVFLACWALLGAAAIARVAVLWWSAQLIWSEGPGLTGGDTAGFVQWTPLLLACAIAFTLCTIGILIVALSDQPRSRALVAASLLAIVVAAAALLPSRWLEAATVRVAGPGRHGPAWLRAASAACNEPVLKALIARGTDVNLASTNGVTPLHLVSRHCEVTVVRGVLDAGAALEATTDAGTTPLMEAVDMNGADAVALLLSRGANPNVQRHDGVRLVDVARQRRNTRIMALVSGAE